MKVFQSQISFFCSFFHKVARNERLLCKEPAWIRREEKRKTLKGFQSMHAEMNEKAPDSELYGNMNLNIAVVLPLLCSASADDTGDLSAQFIMMF